MSKSRGERTPLEPRSFSLYGAWLTVGLTALVVFGIRVHLRQMPLERDEGEYAYAGQLILQAVAPYKEAYNMKLPGTYASYAVLMAVFGQTPSGIHFGLALVNVASIVLIFLVGRKLIDETAGMVAAVVFAFLSTSPSVLGLAGHATHFVVLPALGGMLLLLMQNAECKMQNAKEKPTKFNLQPSTPCRAEASGRRRINLQLFAAGLLFGLSFLMKQQGVFFGIFGLLYLAFRRWYEPVAFKAEIEAAKKSKSKRSRLQSGGSEVRSEPSTFNLQLSTPSDKLSTAFNPWTAKIPPINWGKMSKELAVFAGGLVLPYLLVCLLLIWAGAFHQFLFWTITYAKEYASATPLVNSAGLLREALKATVGSDVLLWVLSCAGLVVIWWDERLGGTDRFFLGALLFCSAASTAVGLYFRAHYFITLLPALGLLAGAAVSRGMRLLRHDNTIELFLALPVFGLLFFGILISLIGNGSFWFTSAADASRATYRTTLFSEALPVAEYVKTNSSPDIRIAVLGSEPEIYFYANRKSATGHIYMYPLMEKQPFALRMQQEMIAEIERRKPEYLVYVDGPLSWIATTNSEQRIYQWWKGYWASNLDLIKTFEFVDEPEEGPTNTHQILVLKRK